MLQRPKQLAAFTLVLLAILAPLATTGVAKSVATIYRTIAQTQPKMVKIYGAGGFRGMEAYQSGMLISPDGHILTVWSHVLDTDYITATLNDGRNFDAKLVGADPYLDVALLKIDAENLPCFDIKMTVDAEIGERIITFSNLFGVATGNEPLSVQHGIVSVKTTLDARRGKFKTPYCGPIYVLDTVTNNPGAPGGALTNRSGQLIGMLGKELRNSQNHTWLNYAMPIADIRKSVEKICSGQLLTEHDKTLIKSKGQNLTMSDLGITMVPDVLQRTPPYVDHVQSSSAAEKLDIRPDDLIVMIDDQLIPSCKSLNTRIGSIDREETVRITILRDGKLLDFNLRTPSEADR